MKNALWPSRTLLFCSFPVLHRTNSSQSHFGSSPRSIKMDTYRLAATTHHNHRPFFGGLLRMTIIIPENFPVPCVHALDSSIPRTLLEQGPYDILVALTLHKISNLVTAFVTHFAAILPHEPMYGTGTNSRLISVRAQHNSISASSYASFPGTVFQLPVK